MPLIIWKGRDLFWRSHDRNFNAWGYRGLAQLLWKPTKSTLLGFTEESWEILRGGESTCCWYQNHPWEVKGVLQENGRLI